MQPLPVSHPCDRPKVRKIVLRFAELVPEFYDEDPDSLKPDEHDEYLAKRNDLARELEWALRR